MRCYTCQKYVKPENHQCYLQPVKAKKTRSAEEGDNLLDDDVAVENDVEDTLPPPQALRERFGQVRKMRVAGESACRVMFSIWRICYKSKFSF